QGGGGGDGLPRAIGEHGPVLVAVHVRRGSEGIGGRGGTRDVGEGTAIDTHLPLDRRRRRARRGGREGRGAADAHRQVARALRDGRRGRGGVDRQLRLAAGGRAARVGDDDPERAGVTRRGGRDGEVGRGGTSETRGVAAADVHPVAADELLPLVA